jgi:hypothetical protein
MYVYVLTENLQGTLWEFNFLYGFVVLSIWRVPPPCQVKKLVHSESRLLVAKSTIVQQPCSSAGSQRCPTSATPNIQINALVTMWLPIAQLLNRDFTDVDSTLSQTRLLGYNLPISVMARRYLLHRSVKLHDCTSPLLVSPRSTAPSAHVTSWAVVHPNMWFGGCFLSLSNPVTTMRSSRWLLPTCHGHIPLKAMR